MTFRVDINEYNQGKEDSGNLNSQGMKSLQYIMQLFNSFIPLLFRTVGRHYYNQMAFSNRFSHYDCEYESSYFLTAFQISLLIKMQTKSITKPHQLIARTVQNDRTRVHRQATIDQIKPKHAINT